MILKFKVQTEEIQHLNFFKLYHKKDLNLEETEEEILGPGHYRKLSIEVTAEEIDSDFLGKRKVNLRLLKQKMISNCKISNLILFLSQPRRKYNNRAINNFKMNFKASCKNIYKI